MTFTATMADPPTKLSFRAKLSWEYYFGSVGGWAVVKTGDGCYIVTDKALELENASIYPDEDAFISWLEAVCDDHMDDDRIGFLSLFCRCLN